MKQKTYYHIILDQSGSMQDCIQPTISGFNEQLQVIKSLQERFPEQDIRVGLTRFNHEVMRSYFALPPEQSAELNRNTYHPGGSTALYDAIGMTTGELNKSIGDELAGGLATVVVVIITDGYENSSRYFNGVQIKSTIKELEATGKWTFSYLGATLDAAQIAASMNIKRQNAMYFEKASMNQTFSKLGKSMGAYLKLKKEGKNPTQFLNSED
ncbi:MAG TPA: vWA domain-containing protein [Parafilimonas sp.]|nr:vWA domain-containing protein [Parafilimonas sp.]